MRAGVWSLSTPEYSPIEEVPGMFGCPASRRSITKVVCDCVGSECFDILARRSRSTFSKSALWENALEERSGGTLWKKAPEKGSGGTLSTEV